MVVKLDMFQEIVNVHWPDDDDDELPGYIVIRANFAERNTQTYEQPTDTADIVAESGGVYAAPFKQLGFAVYDSDFMFESYSVIRRNGDFYSDHSGVVISGQQSVGPAPGEELFTEAVPEFEYAAVQGIIGGTRLDINTGSGRPKETYSGTPLDNPFSSIFVQENLKLRAQVRGFTGLPAFFDLDATEPPDGLVLKRRKVNMGQELEEASFFDPVEGVAVTYMGQPCTLIGTSCQKIDNGPPTGYHAYLALYQIDS